jgi:hypothetical protein
MRGRMVRFAQHDNRTQLVWFLLVSFFFRRCRKAQLQKPQGLKEACMRRELIFITSLIVLSFLAGSASSAIITDQWNGAGGDNDWNKAANWNKGYVPFADNGTDQIKAYFSNSTTNGYAIINAATVPSAQTYQLVIGSLATGGGGQLQINGGVLNVTQYIYIGQTNSTYIGTLTMSGGTINCQDLYVGQVGTGTLTIADGTINASGTFSIADTSTANGTVNLNGGTINAHDFYMKRSGGGTASMNIKGGSLIVDGNEYAKIIGYGSMITANGDSGPGTVVVSYDIGTDKTTVTAYYPSPKATNPSPINGATMLSIHPILNWTAGTGSPTHNIYLDTVNPPVAFKGNQNSTTFRAGPLAYNTTYYWRIDEESGGDTVTGDVWSFTTYNGQAKNPAPASAGTNVLLNKILQWTAGTGSASHDVYFGTDFSGVNSTVRKTGDLNRNGVVDFNDVAMLTDYWLADPAGTEPYAAVNDDNIVDFTDYAGVSQDWLAVAGPAFKGNQDANSFNPGILSFGTAYYWRVDEVNGPDMDRGDTWSFTTVSGKAVNPDPANSAINIYRVPTLSWAAGAHATSHNVYFGTANPPSSVGNQSSTTYSPGTLEFNTPCYWRIDEVTPYGTVQGDPWSFTTAPLWTQPVYPYLTWRNDPTNSVVVSWLNDIVPGDSTVDYGTTDSYGSSVNVPTISKFHHVELTGLTAGQTYHYRIRSSDGYVGADNTYTVPVASPSSFRFAAYGDERGLAEVNEPYYTYHRNLCNWILAQNYDFALQTGDTVWAGSNANSLNRYWPDFFRLEGNLSRSKVVMSTMGNHETQDSSNSVNYQCLYASAFPNNSSVSDANGRVYSFNYGNAHFVCLSSFQINDATIQAPWLASDLGAASANPDIKWIFAFMHAPMYTTGGHANDTTAISAWGPLFDTYHVDIVFAGHNHNYERSKSIKAGAVVGDGVGTVYITTGLGGASFDPTGRTGDPSLFVTFFNNQTLATCVTIDGNNLTVNSITNSDNIVRDAFTLSKD